MSGSGRKERVVISCVTFEVAKVVDPIEYYEATKVHLLHYDKKDPDRKDSSVYGEFYQEVVRRLGNCSRKIEITEHNCPVYNFSEVMRTVLSIIQEEIVKCDGNLDVYVNISAGTSEYSAAALIAAMMNTDVALPFTVSTDQYQVPHDMIRSVYYENGTPVGLTKTTREPSAVSAYPIASPPEDKVLALKILKDQIQVNDTCAATMMALLRDAGIMEPYETRDNDKPQQKAVMKYQRNFVDYWINNGWVEKVSKRKSVVTQLGEDVLNVFYESYAVKNGVKTEKEEKKD